jgi:dihydrofolate reductase
MPKLRVLNLAVSLDGYAAGPNQGPEEPLGVGGMALHEWVFPTRTFQQMLGQDGGETGVDDDYMANGFKGIGATIMGRNMFGPIRGDWPDDQWQGWWGDNPPYHHPVFVLTHYPRESITMEGGTTFHFVTNGIHAAYHQAMEAADGDDVRLGGGAATVREYLLAGLVDEMHIAITNVLLGSGEHLLHEINLPALGYHCSASTASATVTHIVISR